MSFFYKELYAPLHPLTFFIFDYWKMC